MTKKYRGLYWMFLMVHLLLNVGPLLGYSIKALIESDLAHEKVTLTMTIVIVLILSIIAWVNQTTMRSRIWIILLGIYVCIDYIMTPLIIIAVTQVLDEWIFAPLTKSFKLKLTVNKELDKRL